MSINISDLIINIGGQTKWNIKDFLIPFVSVYCGAVLAHKFNLSRERKNKTEVNAQNFIILINQASLLLNELLAYKHTMLRKIEDAFSKNTIQGVTCAIYIPKIIFDFNFEKNIYLSNCNSKFLFLLNQINKHMQLSTDTIEIYKKASLNNKLILLNNCQLSEESVASMLDNFKLIQDNIDKAILYAYILNEKLLKCYKMYFNFLYLENISEKVQIAECYKNDIPNIEDFKEIKMLNENFERCWIYSLNCIESIKLLLRKIRFRLNFLKYFFTLKSSNQKQKNEERKTN